MALTADVCPIYRDAPDRSLGAEGVDIRSLLAAMSAPPGRITEAETALLTALFQSAEGVSIAVFEKTRSLLQLLPRDFPMPEVSIESGTSIELNWDEGVQRVAAVTIDQQERVGFASLVNGDSNYGRFVFAAGAREIPDPMREVLSRIYPRRTSRRAA